VRTILIQAALVGAGGFIGALARYGMVATIHRQIPQTGFPYGTLAVNLIGCLLIGLFSGVVVSRPWVSPELRVFVVMGLLGGFTTFSTFGLDAFSLIRAESYVRSILYMGIHVVAGLFLVWLGFRLTSPNY
jgi:fluoride exporter